MRPEAGGSSRHEERHGASKPHATDDQLQQQQSPGQQQGVEGSFFVAVAAAHCEQVRGMGLLVLLT